MDKIHMIDIDVLHAEGDDAIEELSDLTGLAGEHEAETFGVGWRMICIRRISRFHRQLK